MYTTRSPAVAARPGRPSAAAGEAVLLALAAPRPAFLEAVRATDGGVALVLAGRLRFSQRSDGGLMVACRDAHGRWRRAPECEDLPLLDPARVVDLAIARAVEAALAGLDRSSAPVPADRAYVERRLRADLHPEANGERIRRSLRSALLREVCGRTALRAACLVFGRDLRIGDYNDLIRAGIAVLARVTREVPNLAPLLAGEVRRLSRAGPGRAALGLVGAVRRDLMHGANQPTLARRDWKWLSHQSNATVRGLLGVPQDPAGRHAGVAAVGLFAATQIARPPAVLVAMAAEGGPLGRALAAARAAADPGCFDDLVRLVRLATREWQRRAAQGQSLRFMRDDLVYLIDWWIDQAREGNPRIPADAGWAGLVRRQQRWHQMIILRNPEFLLQWPSAVAAHETSGFRLVPLTDSLMLAREGMEMRHCVASYARDCATGNTRIFAVESIADGERATVELRRRAARWFTGQVKGPCNAEVSAGVRLAAERLASRYAHADNRP